MNFLEELASEWYEYNGYFCRTNIRFGETGHGGHLGEMDVIAYHPKTKEFIHLECSSDSWSWDKKCEVFRKKFNNANRYYEKEFPFEKSDIKKIAITGYSKPRINAGNKLNFGSGIQVILVPDFVASVAQKISKLDPWTTGIHESTYPLLRAIQYGTVYLKRAEKIKNKKLKK